MSKHLFFLSAKTCHDFFKLIKISCHYEFLRKHRSQWPHIQCDMKAEAERSKCPCTILVVDLVYKKIEFQIVMPLSAKETICLSLSNVSERSVSLKLLSGSKPLTHKEILSLEHKTCVEGIKKRVM